jgi:NAD-dependent deacetylase
MDNANCLAAEADLFIVIGTSLNVYPAAGIIDFVKPTTPKWLLDPGEFNLSHLKKIKHLKQTAVKGVEKLKEDLYTYL